MVSDRSGNMGINNPSFVGDDDRPTLESGNGVNAVSAISTANGAVTDERKYRHEENGKMPAVIYYYFSILSISFV